MKTLMKSTLAGLMFAGVMMTTSAQDMTMTGKATMELMQKITQELMTEIPADKMTDQQFMAEKMMDKMSEHIDEIKEASKTDCVAVYGEEKADACACIADKTDYDESFELTKKQMANPTQDLSADMKALQEKAEKTTLDCGFTQEEIDASKAKMLEMMQQAN
ncbi:MAG: hypothetical protein CSA10_00155 [Cardiobacteriales bacterium]|nr:MAG: hypothetical protein CSA10_00155 [Cardiobacteriales bacterium]